MASHSTPRVPNSQANVTLFGMHIAESIMNQSPQFSKIEVGYYYDITLRSESQLMQDYLNLLNTGNEFFHKGQENIRRILRLWDDATNAKELYDTSGIYSTDVQYMRSLLLCVNLVADRFSLGHNCVSEIQRFRKRLQDSTRLPSIFVRNSSTAAQLPSIHSSHPDLVQAPAAPTSLACNVGFPYLPHGSSVKRTPYAGSFNEQASGDTTEDDCQSVGDDKDSVDSSDDTEDDIASTVEVLPHPSDGLRATRLPPQQVTTRSLQVPTLGAPRKRTFAAMNTDGCAAGPMVEAI
ncbi:hypothetical protein SEUCBS140593_010445 [Sporothrix eucalyptigena]|uniref:Uncharacterized protein n=1 Tax=Sporothrix eucalyptigena TaxID=1812306 RepID=A0ABP0D1C6_9PEZI